MSRRTENDIRKSINTCLTTLIPDGQTAQYVLSHAQSIRQRNKKISLVPIFTFLFILLLAAAACATFTFGVLDFRPEQKNDERYVHSIIGIDRQFENEFMTLIVNEAAFDGSQLDLTMNIRHKDGADVVYVIPDVHASCAGIPLSVSIQAVNFNWNEGFFLPEQQPLHMETEQAGVSFHLENMPQNGTINWTLSFDVLRPLFSLKLNERSLDPEEGEDEIPFDVYIQDYLDAYEKGIILLTKYGELVMYDGALSMGVAFGENPWYREGLAQRMIDCGAFERIATFTSHFLTKTP